MGDDDKVLKKSSGLSTISVVLILVSVLSMLFSAMSSGSKKHRQRGVQVDVGGDPGFTVRSARFPSLVEFPWEGGTSLAILFEQSCQKHANKPFLGTRNVIEKETTTSSDGRTFEKLKLSDYKWLSFTETFQHASDFASGLINLGHDRNDRVAIFAETRAEWFISLQGCFRQSITVVTIYASLGEEALVHSLNETEVSTLICDFKQLKKLAAIRTRLESVKSLVYLEEDGNELTSDLLEKLSGLKVISFSEVRRLGMENATDARTPQSSDIAVIMYTSGSTGLPKGVMMSHGNIVATAAAVLTIIPGIGDKDVYLAYLPLAHVLELAAETVMMAAGTKVGYGSALTLTDSSNKVMKGSQGDATMLQPTLMAAVPAILDRVREAVFKKVAEKGGLAKKLFDIAYRRRLAAIEGSWFGAWGLEKLFWDVIVFRKIRSVLGGRIRFMLSGGAPLSGDTQRFINICFGAPIGQGYGLTETCAGATFSEWDDTSVGRVGPPLPCCFIKLVSWEEGGYTVSDKPMPRGEIIIGGPSVTQGYYKNETKTDEVYKVDDKGMRWFSTGDIGQFHSDGCLEIIDRKKDIVKLQHGEYVSLGKVEAALASCQHVENIMLHADPFHNYCVALVVPSHSVLEKWAQSSGVQYKDFTDLCDKKEAVEEVRKALAKEGKIARLDKFEIPAKIKLLPDPWTPESGLVTAALKLKRENLRSTFKEELQQLYT
ncbi:unnamed protein product [Victoria cruziana]